MSQSAHASRSSTPVPAASRPQDLTKSSSVPEGPSRPQQSPSPSESRPISPEGVEEGKEQQAEAPFSSEQKRNNMVNASHSQESEGIGSRKRKATEELAEDHHDDRLGDQAMATGSHTHDELQTLPIPVVAGRSGQEAIGRKEPESPASPTMIEAHQSIKEALVAVKANTKTAFNNGDVLFILDPTDPTRSCLLESAKLDEVSATFKDLRINSAHHVALDRSVEGLTGVFVLLPTESAPELVAVPLDEALKTAELEDDSTPGERVKERAAEKARAKRECRQDLRNTQESQMHSKPDWPKVYDSLFRIAFSKRHGLPKNDAAAAMPQIEGIVAVAKKYDVFEKVKSTILSLFLEYIQHRTLWEAIEQAPARWIRIAVALESRLIYDEAFKHLVGLGANHAASKTLDHDLPTEVQAIISGRSHALYNERMAVEKNLMLLTLPSVDPSRRGPQIQQHPSQFANQHNRPTEYSTVNILTDWLKAHIGEFDQRDAAVEPIGPLDGVCDHKNGCCTVAGFYGVIYMGGNAYLPSEDVCKDWSAQFPKNDARIKSALEVLKAQASELVAGFVISDLQLAGKDKLPYLSCVKVGLEDVAWRTECKDEDGDDVEEDDD